MQVAIYPYRVRIDNTDRLLLWMTNGQDQFKLGKDGDLLVARTRRDAARRCGADAELVRWNEPASLNIDEFWSKVAGLRPHRKSSVPTCKVLLEGWNFFDDLLGTLSKVELLEASRAPRLRKIYDKLFYGSNLKAVTPDGRVYHPEWTTNEIKSFRKVMRSIWSAVKNDMKLR